MSKKYYAVYSGQIKIDNEVFFGIDYKITDFINELMEQCKKQQEIMDTVINIINQHFKHHPELLTENQIEYELIRKIENILKEVSE